MRLIEFREIFWNKKKLSKMVKKLSKKFLNNKIINFKIHNRLVRM